MSTRYVWEKCDINYPEPSWTLDSYGISFTSPTGSGHQALSSIACSDFSATLHQGGNSNATPSVYVVVATGAESATVTREPTITSSAGKPFVINTNVYQNIIAKAPANDGTGGWFISQNIGTSSATYTLRWTKSTISAYQSYYTGTIDITKISKGQTIGKVSSSSSTAYPKGTYKKPNTNQNLSEWYEYLGADSIDPTAINYDSSLRGNEPVTVSVTPASGTYGGTISYSYQYSTDNGSTWTVIENTTETSIVFNIPTTANTLRFRVRASDNMGFVSTDFVTGPNVTVERLDAWVPLLGKAKKGQYIWARDAAGKAHKGTMAWVRDSNGKARRFL